MWVMSDISIIELAGVPGAGKSSACTFLRKSLGNKHLFITRTYIGSRYKLFISLPLIPYTILKFYRVFRKLIQIKIRHFRGPVSARTVLSILAALNSSMMEYWLATLEAAIRRKKVLLDGGFIQWGISVWLRTPPEIQADLWSAYLSHIPRDILCIVFKCEPADALRRTQSRCEGVPEVIQSRRWSLMDENWLEDQYQKISDLLNDEELQSRVTCIYLSSEIDAKKKAELISSNLEKFIPLRNLVTT